MWSRIHLIPLLQAEEDRDLVRRHLADKAREKELLGSETKAYNSDRYGNCFSCVGTKLTVLPDSFAQPSQSHQRTSRNESGNWLYLGCTYWYEYEFQDVVCEIVVDLNCIYDHNRMIVELARK